MKGRQYCGLDLLRGISAFFIVGCHLRVAETAGGSALLHFCNMNVGVFAAVSGFLLAKKVENVHSPAPTSYFDLIWSRVARLGPAYLFWTAFYLVASPVFALLVGKGYDWSRLADPVSLFGIVFRGFASCHLWFVASLVYASAVAVLLLAALAKTNRCSGWLLLALGFACVWAATRSDAHFFLYDLRLFGFVLIGAGIAHLKPPAYAKATAGKQTSTLVLALALVLHVVLARWVPGFVRDAIVVIPLLALATEEWPASRIGGWLNRVSFGVYLWHPFFAAGLCAVLGKLLPHPFGAGVVLFDWVLCYLLAVVGTMAMQRTFLKRFV